MTSNSINIGFADKIHAYEISQIEEMCFSLPWSQNAISDFLNYDYNKILCAFYDGNIVGYISYSLICGECSIENVAVKPSFRKCGIGSLILQRLLELLKEQAAESIFLEVRKSNTPAINLYKKHGFLQCGERKNFYSKPTENALLMSLTL